MADFIPAHWVEGFHPDSKTGDGVSRPQPGAMTRHYRLRITGEHIRPMTVTLPAESKQRAIRYASNRWPETTIEVLP